VIATHLVTAAMIGAEVWLQVQKQAFLDDFALETRAENDPHLEQRSYDQGMQLLQIGSLAEARTAFSRVQPGGRLYPDALYKITSIHVTAGAYEQALEGFDRIAAEYPLPSLYDLSLKGAADLLLRLGRFSESLQRLELMTFVDKMYSREEIDAYSCEILARWAQQSVDVLPRAIEAYRRLTAAYPDSPRIGVYQSALARLLVRAGGPLP
jgi:tetratricopeptide (TPR) repeat protein